MSFSNYHTHSLFCDGTDLPETYVQEAIKKGMDSIGFSSHAPVPFKNGWSMKYEKLEEYQQTIRSLQKKYKDKISIYLGLEIDYIPGITTSFDEFKERINPDYTIGAIHLIKKDGFDEFWFIDGPEENYHKGLKNIFNNNIGEAVKAYYDQLNEMIITQKPIIIAHFDKVKMYNRNRYFREDESWYKKLVAETIDTIATSGAIAEVNTRGVYKKKSDSLYPGIEILQQLFQRKIPVTISADAHEPSELTNYFEETVKTLKDIGFKNILALENGKWKEKSL